VVIIDEEKEVVMSLPVEELEAEIIESVS